MARGLIGREGGYLINRLKKWWDQPDQFESMTAILRQRDLVRSTQILLAVIASAAGLVPLTVLITSAHSTATAYAASVLAGCYTVANISFFLLRWPTRMQSALAASGGAAVIATWSLAQSDTTLRFLACSVMVISGGYFAVFHNTKLLLLNLGASIAVAVVAVIQLAHEAGVGVAFASFWVLGLLNVAISLGARGLSRSMTQYAAHSRDDPLTGLLNRRGWNYTISRQLSDAHRPGHTHLTVLMIDLDGFKRINDTYGHADGDRLLVGVADLLRLHCPPQAAMSRAGGEEFLVSFFADSADPPELAAALCSLIADLSESITASIGTASMPLTPHSRHNIASTIDQLTMTADNAMYTAKRNGGNQTHHTLCIVHEVSTQ